MIHYTIQCRRSKVTKKGTSRVEAAISDGTVRTIITTDYVYDPELWEHEIKRKRQNGAKRIAAAVSDDINGRITALRQRGFEVTALNIKNSAELLHKKTTRELREEYTDTLKPRVGESLSFSQYRKYLQVLDDIASLDKRVEDLTAGDLEALNRTYSTRYKPSTLAGYTSKIKTVIQYAHSMGYISFNPSSGLKVKKTPENVVTVTDEEYRRIRTKTLCGRLDRVRDAFVFMCSTGLSYIDFKRFDTNGTVDSEGLTIYTGKRAKTGAEFYSVLLPDALEVLNKYGGDLTKITMSNQKYNAYLKEIGDICGISVTLTCHRARHYYARRLLMSGLSETVISKCLGHTNTVQTAHYVRLLRKQNITMVTEAFRKISE